MYKESVNIALQDILNSNTFLKSDICKQLLNYLVSATLEKKIIKEYTIAHEVFNKDNNWGVRSYMHTLRKKLDEYYSSEGAKSIYIFSIPKGQYYINIEKREDVDKRRKKSMLKPKYFIAGSFILLSGILITIILISHDKIENSIIWKDFMNSKEPIMIVIGDHYFYGSNVTTGGKGVMRAFQINSESEFDTFLQNHSELKDSIYKINFTYTTKQGMVTLFTIMPYLQNNKNMTLKLSSELNFDDIKQYNIIYFGKFNTMEILKKFVYDTYYTIDEDKRMLHFILKDTVIQAKLTLDNIEKVDYPLVLKFRTPYQKNILMFIGNDDPGVIATLNFFLNFQNVKFIENKLQLTAKENTFTTLFKVRGLARTDMSIEFVTGSKL